MTLYLLDFNNYYNRVKRTGLYYHNLDTFKVGEIENINFNPNDGISTEVVANWVIGKTEPDYAVLADDDTNTIISRWFVMEAVRTRAGQYRFILRRDLLVDFEADYMNRPCFIEKAMLRDGDPFIFNSEDMTFNQIKQKEILLKDPTHCAWIVGYINKNRENKNISAEVSGVGEYATYSSWAAYPYKTDVEAMIFKSAITNNQYKVIVEDGTAENVGVQYQITFDESGWYTWEKLSESMPTNMRGYLQLTYNQYVESVGTVIGRTVRQWANRAKSINLTNEISRVNGNHTTSETATFLNRVPQTIKLIDTGEYVSIKRGASRPTTKRLVPDNGSALALELYDMLSAASDIIVAWNLTNSIAPFVELPLEYEIYPISQTEYKPFKYEMTLYGSNAVNGLTDAPYDMFAIPYPTDEYEISCSVIESGVTKTGVIEAEAGMMIANSIATTLTEAGCYDIQLLPYCPIPSLGRTPAHIDLTNMELNKDYCLITATFNNSTTIRSVCLYPTKSTFTLNLYNYWDRAENVIKDYSIPIKEKKIQALTEMNRICSPNYNGQFEFNAAKNNGVDYFNVDCTYKPFQPYIHIAPNFKGLYGGDYDDSRGLICGGDFSLPRITDKWQQYELNNKNYMNSFNRTIENMEVQQNYQKTQELVNAITGTFSGAASGAAMGAMTGGGAVGLGVGAAVGGLAAGAAGIADIQMGEKLRSEALDFTKDQFGYALGNIKALPYALSRVSSFNANNKIYPVLEFYSATEEEKQALRNKIKYNGMTVMRIDKLSNYVYYEFPLVYLKGRMINLSDPDNLDEHAIDTHLAIELSNEIYKGFYLILQTGGLEL